MKNAFTALIVTGLLLGLAPASADAQASPIRGLRPEVHLDLGLHGFFGVGFDLEFAIVPDGFLRSPQDELALAVGLDLLLFDFRYDGDRGIGFAPNVTAQWNIYLGRKWSVFPELGFTLLFVTRDDHRYYRGYGRGRNVYADAVAGFGARYFMTPRLAWVFRIGYPFGAQVGLNF